MNVKEIIKNNNVVFSHYRNKVFYYKIICGNNTYQFPVELKDIEGATLQSADKAIYFMRWINKAIKNNEFVHIN